MSDFTDRMHEIQFPLRSCPRGRLQHSPSPLAVFKWPTFKGMEGKGRREGEREGKERDGLESAVSSPSRVRDRAVEEIEFRAFYPYMGESGAASGGGKVRVECQGGELGLGVQTRLLSTLSTA